MKRIFGLLIFVSFISLLGNAQTIIRLKKQGGVFLIPCKVNGLALNFIFDTGASDVTISLTEALFMLKNGYLKNEDITGTTNITDATGSINEGYTIILREIEFSGLKLNNVSATIVKELDAPLLLGQSAIGKLGPIKLDVNSNTLTILKRKSNYDFSIDSSNDQSKTNKSAKEVKEITEKRQKEVKDDGSILRISPDETSQPIYWIPKDSKVELIEVVKLFAKISFNGKIGYIPLSEYKKFFEKK